MKNKTILLLLIILSTFAIYAQNVEFKAISEKVVQEGEQFRIVYSVNASVSGFVAPKFEGFDILLGPAKSSSSSFQFINGKSSQSVEETFTYILQAKKTGKYEIPAATVTVDGKSYKSNSLPIEVIKGEASNTTQNNQNTNQKIKTNDDEIDLFVRVNVNKTTVYQGEHIIATIKLYTRSDLVGFNDMKFPTYTGFWTQDVFSPTNITLEREEVNGKIYNVGVMKQSILFPQQSGQLYIDPYELECVVRQKTGTVQGFWGNFFDQFENVTKKVVSPQVKINVLPLPNKPDNFSGAVGSDFKLLSSVDRTNVKTNDGFTLKISISGNGNLKLIDKLNLNLPQSFEVYDPKIDNAIRNTATGAIGTKTFEYLIIPRNAGTYKIDPFQFTYFDTQTKSYKSLYTSELEINVAKGAADSTTTASYTQKQDLEILGNDIKFIYQNDFDIVEKRKTVFGTSLFWSAYIFLIFIFTAVVILGRKHIKRMSDINFVKNKQASKVSKSRLKLAAKHLKENNSDHFHDEIAKALWGYISDKLAISGSELNRENSIEALKKRSIDEQTIQKFINLIDKCEYARYAPAAQSAELESTYKDATHLIDYLEEKLS